MSTLVGKQAPDFTAAAVRGNGEIVDHFHFSKETQGKDTVVFFYPLDFTFVCPSELVALDNRMSAFQERQVEVLSVSIDSQFTHHKYRQTSQKEGGIGEVSYTMVADVAHTICQAYGVEHPDAAVAFRATFVIDNQGVIRSQIVNDLPLGRNVDEILRIVDAMQFTREHGEVCPAGWQKGKPAMKPSIDGMQSYLAENADHL